MLLNTCVSKKKTNIAKAARDFGVPASRLRARGKGRQPRSQRTPLNRELGDTQEHALKTYINTLDEIIIPPAEADRQISQ
jgi:hypothetical protein